MPMFEIPGMPGGQIGAVSLGDMLGKAFGNKGKPRRMTVKDAYEPLIAEESDKLVDQDRIVSDAIRAVEEKRNRLSR
jgi:ATP-dependent HslUV protease ATP-binding subunit HslU